MDGSLLLRKLTAREDLARGEARELFDGIMSGAVEPPMLGAVLAALATKGETVDEIVGAAEAMRACVTPVQTPAGVEAIDVVGTGGDGKPTFNISSAVSIVCAAAGATVAKHGNRSNARPSGAAQGLAALGINIDADVPTLEKCLADCRITFLYAIKLHPAMKHAAPVRKAIGIRTIFNLVGPLTNPAGVRRHLLGVSRPELVEVFVAALQALGEDRALVVHGRDGLCDLSLSGKSLVGRLDGDRVTIEEIDAGVIGVAPAPLEALYVTSPEESAARIERIFAGEAGPGRDMVVLNAAAALWVAGLAEDWTSAANLAVEVLDGGSAAATLAAWRERSQGGG